MLALRLLVYMYLLAPLRPGNMSWAHLSCALWIPEVRVGNVEKMEPITNVDVVPVSMCVCVCEYSLSQKFNS